MIVGGKRWVRFWWLLIFVFYFDIFKFYIGVYKECVGLLEVIIINKLNVNGFNYYICKYRKLEINIKFYYDKFMMYDLLICFY